MLAIRLPKALPSISFYTIPVLMHFYMHVCVLSNQYEEISSILLIANIKSIVYAN